MLAPASGFFNFISNDTHTWRIIFSIWRAGADDTFLAFRNPCGIAMEMALGGQDGRGRILLAVLCILSLEAAIRLRESCIPLDRYASKKPRLPDARINLGDALHALGRPQEAIVQYEEFLRIERTTPWPTTLGQRLNRVGTPRGGHGAVPGGRADQPDYVEALNSLGRHVAHVRTPRGRNRAIPGGVANQFGLRPGPQHLGNALIAYGTPPGRADAVPGSLADQAGLC